MSTRVYLALVVVAVVVLVLYMKKKESLTAEQVPTVTGHLQGEWDGVRRVSLTSDPKILKVINPNGQQTLTLSVDPAIVKEDWDVRSSTGKNGKLVDSNTKIIWEGGEVWVKTTPFDASYLVQHEGILSVLSSYAWNNQTMFFSPNLVTGTFKITSDRGVVNTTGTTAKIGSDTVPKGWDLKAYGGILGKLGSDYRTIYWSNGTVWKR